MVLDKIAHWESELEGVEEQLDQAMQEDAQSEPDLSEEERGKASKHTLEARQAALKENISDNHVVQRCRVTIA